MSSIEFLTSFQTIYSINYVLEDISLPLPKYDLK